MFHQSVLLEEALHFLDPRPGSVIVDGTLGCAGHAKAILEKIGGNGLLIGFDKDPEALAKTEKTLFEFRENALLIHDDFKNMAERLQEIEKGKVQGILLDLGVSSGQLDSPERGFSFRAEGPLDMRMNPSEMLTAREIVNRHSKETLLRILWEYGEERFAKKIVQKILEVRARKKIETTTQLASIISEAVPVSYRYGRIHPSTRTFQALRIAVNGEIESLEIFLNHFFEFLDKGGRLVIISFHSLEDRLVKTAFRQCGKEGKGRVLTKKPVIPKEAEMTKNPRSRSAKLRAFERT